MISNILISNIKKYVFDSIALSQAYNGFKVSFN